MPTTLRGQFRCIAKEGADRPFSLLEPVPFLALEPVGEEPQITGGRGISIELRAGTTYEQAKALAQHLDQYMVGLAITRSE
jgi:hypothetical protein